MSLRNVMSRIKLGSFNGEFSDDEKRDIKKSVEDAYTYSTTAREMFEIWIRNNPTNIDIKCNRRISGAGEIGTGTIFLNPEIIKNLSYVTNNGTTVPYALIGALIHELGHALASKRDPTPEQIANGDYVRGNVPFVNIIWSELTQSRRPGLNLPPMLDYIATADRIFQKANYQYIDGQYIDNAVNVDYMRREDSDPALIAGWNSSNALGSSGVPGYPGVLGSRDLLIGGSRKNHLQSGQGNDFLFGGVENDLLQGGEGQDTAIYFGNVCDYRITQNFTRPSQFVSGGERWDGTWTVRDKLSGYSSGNDRLENIEFVQFDDPRHPGRKKTYPLRPGGIPCQSDIAFVIDRTNSMGLTNNTIEYLKQQAPALFNAIYRNNHDVRVGAIAFGHTTNGEPSQVILPFTDQEEIADRHLYWEHPTFYLIDRRIKFKPSKPA